VWNDGNRSFSFQFEPKIWSKVLHSQFYPYYYDIRVKPKTFVTGQWVLYFNPRKFRGKQNKWIRNYEGPYLVIDTPSVVTAKIQKSAKAKPKSCILTS